MQNNEADYFGSDYIKSVVAKLDFASAIHRYFNQLLLHILFYIYSDMVLDPFRHRICMYFVYVEDEQSDIVGLMKAAR